MTKYHFLSLLAFLTCTLSLPAAAQTLDISGAYAYATAPVQKNGAVFMVIENSGPDDEKITGASTDAADKAELHTTTTDKDIMMMRQVESYDIPENETLILEPMGNHIMLMGLKAPLKTGETFPLTLTLENGGTLDIEVAVKNPGETDE